MSFDYGAEPVSAGKSFKNPEVGKHAARLRSIIHLGIFQEDFKGKLKDKAPEVVAIFELCEETDYEDDGTTPLTISKSFPLRQGDKSFLTTMEKVFMREGDTSMDDWIGRACEIDCKGSKELGDDKKPKYINFGGISTLHPKLEKLIEPELQVKGVGHCRFADLTKEAIEELHPIREVADILLSEHNHSYSGSKVEAIIAEIRKDNKDFAVRKATDKPKQDGEADADEAPATKGEPPANLNPDEEF